MKLVTLLQVRMGSSRLPGKTLAEARQKPLLSYMLERLAKSSTIPKLVIATSIEPADDAIERYCRKAGLECFRGSHQDVAGRFLAAAEHYGAEAVVRLCGDSPWIDPAVIEQVLSASELKKYDIITNVFPRSFPKGQSVEVLVVEALKRAHAKMALPEHREHLTRFFYENPKDFRILNVASSFGNFADKNLCVDTPEDFECFKHFLETMQKPFSEYTWQEILPMTEDIRKTLRSMGT